MQITANVVSPFFLFFLVITPIVSLVTYIYTAIHDALQYLLTKSNCEGKTTENRKTGWKNRRRKVGSEEIRNKRRSTLKIDAAEI